MLVRRAFLAFYALSGAAALIYEVCWTRVLALHMGHTSASVSTVLAAFMGGLAAGAALGGRFASRLERSGALRWYAVLEIAIAVCALLLPVGLATFDPFLARAYANGDGGLTFALTRLISSLLVIVLPCALMGATFPMAARWFIRDVAIAGGDAGAMYAANTVGATAGAIAAGFWLIPLLGLRGTTWVAVALNVVAAAGAAALSGYGLQALGSRPDRLQARSLRGPKPEARSPKSPARPRAAALAIAVSGFVALVDEVVWTRVFALVIGPTTYAFSAMLAAFVAGIALGSAMGSTIARRARLPLAWLAACLGLSALGSLGAASLVDRVLLTVGERIASPDVSFGSLVWLQSIVASMLLLPLTVALGAAFPLAVATAAERQEDLASEAADLYSANTLGAIAGSLAAGFAFVPLVGLNATLRVAAACSIVVSATLLLGADIRRRTRVAGPLVAIAGIAAAVFIPRWDVELLSSGAYKYAPYLRATDLRAALTLGTLLYYKEGASATVSVKESAGSTSLAIDGKVDASNSGDMLTQKLLAHLPLLLHSKPRDVAIVGLGSGVTAAAAVRHPVARVDVLEISAEVVHASRYFKRENHDVLADPRLNLIVGDGRTHLLLASRQYDVIVSEPSNPWMAGVATLFTREFFQAARRRLASGGILCQWAHTYDISDGDLRSIAATFRSVFPDGTMWLVGGGDLLLIGSDRPLEASLPQIAESWKRPGVAADLQEVEAQDPLAVYSTYVAGAAGLARFAGPDARLQTDDHLRLEFSAPRSIYGRSTEHNVETLRELSRDETPPPAIAEARRTATAQSWRDLGRMLLRAETASPAVDALLRALVMNPSDPETLASLTKAAVSAERIEEVEQAMERVAAQQPDNRAVRIELSRILTSRGRVDEGIRMAEAARRIGPDDPAAREQLASIYADVADVNRLEPLVEEMRRAAPERDDTVYYTAALAFLSGQPAAAIEPAARLATRNPKHAKALNLLGASYASLGRTDEARRAFQASILADPRDPAAYTNVGVQQLQSGNAAGAVDDFAQALAIDPSSQAAREGLAEALDRVGERERAAKVRMKPVSP